MRDGIKPASLGELMGKGFEHRDKLTLEDLPKLLGEKMPHIPYDRVGRVRLVNALHQRFGPGFKSVPGIADILKEFDKEMHIASVVKMNNHANQLRKDSKPQKMYDGGTAGDDKDEKPTSLLDKLKDAFAPYEPPKTKTPVPQLDTKKAGEMADYFNKADGGRIPGKALVAGDSIKNDKVKALLSPGEIVIPRSITMHPDAAILAAAFVKKELKKHRG